MPQTSKARKTARSAEARAAERRSAARGSASAAILTALGVAWIEVQSVGAVALAATTVLIVPGTGTSDPSVAHNFESNAYQNFIDPGVRGCTDNVCPGVIFVPVPYDASLWPVISSQGATVASAERAALAGLTPQDKNRLTFVLIANPNRPNGGIIERPVRFGEIPVADISFGPPTPTDTGIATTDIAMQYDGISDFPAYPLNVLADANALLGTLLIHPSYLQPKGNGAGSEPKAGAAIYGYRDPADYIAQQNCDEYPENCQIHGDTLYKTIPSPEGTVPLLYPLRAVGQHTNATNVTEPAAALLEPALRVLIETGYDRTDYATPTPSQKSTTHHTPRTAPCHPRQRWPISTISSRRTR